MNLKYEEIEDTIKEEIKKDIKILSKKQISKKYNISMYFINLIINNGEFIRSNKIYKKKYNYNEHFFDNINTEEKAYWLGFIYADGYIGGNNQIGIGLSSVDKNHLEKFRISLNSNKPIQDYLYNGNYSCKFTINSFIMKDQLRAKGILKNKTYNMIFPDDTIVPNNLIPHFMRGFFDGDGTINIQKQYKTNQCRFQLVAPEDFLIEYIKRLPIKQKIKVLAERKPNQPVKVVQFGGNNICKLIFDFLYKDATIYLDRKFKKYQEHFKL